jgi:hypothetical protein
MSWGYGYGGSSNTNHHDLEQDIKDLGQEYKEEKARGASTAELKQILRDMIDKTDQ